MLSILPEIIVIFVAFGGFVLAAYMRHKKLASEVFVCPMKADCETVVHSEFSKFLGVPVELLGMFYYGFIALSYATFLIATGLLTSSMVFLMLLITTSAFLFSVYLTFIQAFAIKQWCTWCLTSAGLTTVIFLVAVVTAQGGLATVLAGNAVWLAMLQSIGMALGVGSATVFVLLLMKFLKDFKITDFEEEIMKQLSQVAWFGLAMVVLGGVGLYGPLLTGQGVPPVMWLELVMIVIILAASASVSLLSAPRLLAEVHEAGGANAKEKLRAQRQRVLRMSVVMVGAWYLALIIIQLGRATIY